MIYDVIIIGGGVTGAAIARELSRYRLKIALLEKEEELAFGVSKSNSGIVHPGTQNSPDSLKGKLCVQGNRLMREVARELGVDFKEVGELIVAFNDEEVARLKELKREAESLGVPRLEIVGRAWLDEREPNLSKEVVAALYAPTAGIISPYRLVYDLSENARSNGVDIHTRCAVTGIELGTEPFFSSKWSTSGVRKRALSPVLFTLETTNGKFQARHVINAAGLFADEISRMVGIDDFKITPRKGEEFLLDKKRENIANHLIFPLPGKSSKGVLIIKTSDGNPMIGPTAQEVDDKTDFATSDEGLDEVVASVQKMMPSINPKDIIAYFAGLRPAAGHDFIIRHEERVPGFINVAGIQSPGLTAAPAIALMVVDLLRDNGVKLKKKFFFNRRRKKTTHLFAMSTDEARRLIEKEEGYGDIVCRCEMVSRKEIEEAIVRGAKTLDGIKFRTRAQAGRCHGGFCTTRIMKILSEKTGRPLTQLTKRGGRSCIVLGERD